MKVEMKGFNKACVLRRTLGIFLLGAVCFSGYASERSGNDLYVHKWSSPAVAPTTSEFAAFDLVQELSILGPQFPESFDMSNFAVFYIVRADWPIAIRYELEEGASASIFVKPMLRGAPMRIDLPSTGLRNVRKAFFVIPSEYGGPPQPAELRFRASIRSSEKTRPANFTIHSLGCGGGAFAGGRSETHRPLHHGQTNFQQLSSSQRASGDEVAIGGISLVPLDVFNASHGGHLVFGFRSSNDFTMWSASFQRQIRVGGTVWRIEKTMPFKNEPITQGQTISKSWDGKNKLGTVQRGSYKVMISAWTSANVDGSAVTSFSSPAFQVR